MSLAAATPEPAGKQTRARDSARNEVESSQPVSIEGRRDLAPTDPCAADTP